MAATVLTAVTVIGTGVAVNTSSVVTAGTVTISVGDMSRSFVTLQNNSTTASCIVSLGAGADPMIASGIGAQSITLTTAQTQLVGGSWDSERFKTTAGTVVFTFPTAATVTIGLGVLAR
jgi:hypothetical protein